MNRLTERYKIARLIARKVSGTISEEEADELEAWVGSSARYREEVTRIESRLREDIRQGRELNMTGEWDMFQQKLSRKRSIRWWRYSAAIVVVGVCAIFVLQLRETKTSVQIARSVENNVKEYKAKLILDDGSLVNITDTTRHVVIAGAGTNIMASGSGLRYESGDSLLLSTPVKYNTLIVPRGGEYDLLLSDGSRLRMNSESEVRVPVTFEKGQREVFMKGEIYFDIVRDSLAPFVVHTRQGDIRVLGTSFNVRDYQDEDFLETTLVDGKVAFERKGDCSYLKPGEQLRLNKKNGKTTVEAVDVLLYCSWKDGRFAFEKQRLEEIMNTIARWYNIEVFYESSSVKDILFTGNIKRYSDLDQVVNMLKLINKIDIDIKDRNVFVRSNE